MARLRPIGPKLVEHRLHEGAIDHLVEIDGTLDETLLALEGEVMSEAYLVYSSGRVHASRGDQLVDIAALDRRRLGQDGNDVVRIRPVEPAVLERAIVKADGTDVGAHEPSGGIGALECELLR